jgi:hypothetical protein
MELPNQIPDITVGRASDIIEKVHAVLKRK